MKLLSNEGTAFAEVARVLNTDAALAAEVVRLANSPLGSRYRPTTIVQALSLLGIARVSGLVLTLTMSKLLTHAGRSEVVRRCWRHNLATAVAAKDLAATFDVDPEQAYTAGLMHDIGRLGLVVHAPEEYESLLQTTQDIRTAERQVFGIDHCQAGEWIAREWNLPAYVAEVTLHHHDPISDQSPLAIVVHVACAMATQLGYRAGSSNGAEESLTISDELSFSIADSINAVECEFGI